MAITTKATTIINFKAQTQEVDAFFKKLEEGSKIPMSENLRKDFKALATEAKQLQDFMSNVSEDQMTPDLYAEVLKKQRELIKRGEKLNKKIIKESGAAVGETIDKIQQKISSLKVDIQDTANEIEKEEKKFGQVTDASGETTRKFNVKADERRFMEQTADDLGIRDQMKGASGKNIKDTQAMLKNTEKMEATLNKSQGLYEKINKEMAKGKSIQEAMDVLDDAELDALQKLVENNHKNFTLEEALYQIQLKQQLEQKKETYLKEKDIEIADKELDLAAKINEEKKLQKRNTEEYRKAQEKATKEQKKQLEFSEEFGNTMMGSGAKASAEYNKLQKEIRSTNKETKVHNKELEKNQTTLAKATNQVFNYGLAFTALRRIYRETLRTIRDLDSALTEMAIVTSMNRSEVWELIPTLQQLAKETGFTTTEVAKLSTVYFRQGRTLREVIELTRVAAQAARVAGISATESANFLTSAVNAFRLSADEALAVSDRFAALAANSASSYEELATGLSKFAAQANVAGIGIDFAMGMLAKGVETTREAPETIGTAIKSVTARMRELSDLGKTFEDGMDINRVETALRQVGVALRDESGQFRNLENVLTDVGMRWENLNKNQQASVAVALAGIRQQSRLIAIMNDFDRTLELTTLSQESAGATTAQQAQFMQGMQAATVSLQTAYQKFITTITESETLIGIVQGLANALDGLSSLLQNIGFEGSFAMTTLIALFGALKFGGGVTKLYNRIQEKKIRNQEIDNLLTINSNKLQQQKFILDKKNLAIASLQNQLDNRNLGTKKRKIIVDKIANLEQEKENILNSQSLLLKEKIELQDKRSIVSEGILSKLRKIRNSDLAKTNIFTAIYNKLQKMKNKINVKSIFTMQAMKKAGLGVTNSLKSMGKGLVSATKATIKFGVALLTTPLGWIAMALATVVAGFFAFRKGSEDAENGVDSFAATFYKTFEGLGEAIKLLVDSFSSFWKSAKPLLAFFASPIINYFKNVLNVISLIVNKIVIAMNKWTISNAQAGEQTTNVFEKIFNAIRTVFDALGKLRDIYFDVLNTIVNAAASALNFLIRQINRIPGINIPEIGKFDLYIKSVGERIGEWGEKLQEATDESQETAAQLTKDAKLLTNTYEELGENIAEVRKESEAENYELRQKNRSLQELINEREELAKLEESGLFGEEEEQRMASLREEIANLDEELQDIRNGEIQIDASLELIRSDIEKNKEEIRKNLLEVAEEALILANKDFERFVRGDQGALSDIQAYLLNLSSDSLEPDQVLSENQTSALSEYFKNIFETAAEDAAGTFDPDNLIQFGEDVIGSSQFNELISSIESFDDLSRDGFSGIVELRDQFNALSQDLTGDALEAFNEVNKNIVQLFDTVDQANVDNFNIVLDEIGFSNDVLNNLTETLEGTNYSLNEFISSVGETAVALNETMGETEAVSKSIIDFASTLEDGQAAAELYSLALGRPLLEATQAADQLSSRLDKLTESQEKFISGDISDQEIFDLIENYSELFSDPDFFAAFRKGEDLSRFLFEDSREQAEEYRIQLYAVEKQLQGVNNELKNASEAEKEQLENRRDALLSEQNRLLLLTQTRTELTNITRTQYEYNKALQAFNQVSEVGINSLELQSKMVDKLSSNIGPALKITSDNIANIQSNIANILGEGTDPSQIYSFVDGVVTLKGAFLELDEATQEALTNQFNSIESQIDNIFEVYKTFMDSTISLEEKMASEKIKVYQDYFSSLDRLEEQRKRKVQREDIVTELTRLQSATDEASRKRALDLRKELNKLDEDANQKSLEESRKTLIKEIEDSVVKIKNTFEQIFKDFVLSGKTSGEALFKALQDAGLVNTETWEDLITKPIEDAADMIPNQIDVVLPEDLQIPIPVENPEMDSDSNTEENASELKTNSENIQNNTEELGNNTEALQNLDIPNSLDLEADTTTLEESNNNLKTSIDNLTLTLQNSGIPEQDGLPETLPFSPGGSSTTIGPENQQNKIEAFAKGGLVDYTGIAQLHGSNSSPEAVLNPMQTEMFMGLRDALEKVSVDSNSTGNVNIEKIAISTESMNSNQDFKRAGESLAEAFKGAIQRKGITINTNKV